MYSFSKRLLKGVSNTINKSFEKWIVSAEINIFEPEESTSDEYEIDGGIDRYSNCSRHEEDCSNATNSFLKSNIFSPNDETSEWEKDYSNISPSHKCIDSFENSSLPENEINKRKPFKDTAEVETSKTSQKDFGSDLLPIKLSAKEICSNKRSFSIGDGPSVLTDRQLESVKNNSLIHETANVKTGKTVGALALALSNFWMLNANKTEFTFNKYEASSDDKVDFPEGFGLNDYVRAFWHFNTLENIFRRQRGWKFAIDNASYYLKSFADLVLEFCLRPMYSMFEGFLEIFLFVVFLTIAYIYNLLRKYLKRIFQAFIFLCLNDDIPDSVKLYVQKEIHKALERDKIQREINYNSNQPLTTFGSPKSSTPKQTRVKSQKYNYPRKFGSAVKKSQTKLNVPSSRMQKIVKLWEIYNKKKQDRAIKDNPNNTNFDLSHSFSQNGASFHNNEKYRLLSPIKSYAKTVELTDSDNSLFAQVGSLMSALSYSEIECFDNSKFESYFSDKNTEPKKNYISVLKNTSNNENKFQLDGSGMHSDTKNFDDSYSKNKHCDFNELESRIFDVNSAENYSKVGDCDKVTTKTGNDMSFYKNKNHEIKIYESYNSSLHDVQLASEIACHDNTDDFDIFDLQIPPREDSKNNEFSSFLIGCLDRWESIAKSNNGDETISSNASFLDTPNKLTDKSSLDNDEVTKLAKTNTFEKATISSSESLENEIKSNKSSKMPHKEMHEIENYFTPLKEFPDRNSAGKQFSCKTFDDQTNDGLPNSISVQSNEINISDFSLEEMQCPASRLDAIDLSKNLEDGTQSQFTLNCCSNVEEESNAIYNCFDSLESAESLDSDFSPYDGKENHSFFSKNKSISAKMILKGCKSKSSLTQRVPFIFRNWKKLQSCKSHVLKRENPYEKHYSEG